MASKDKLFPLVHQKKQKFLLRLLNRNQFESQLPAIKFLQKCGKTINNVPKVYSFGITSDENYAFLLLDYITGENGMKVIQNYNTDDQYLLGYKMGKTLFDIHNLKTYADEYNETCNYKQEVEKYLKQWDSLENYVLQESALDKLFFIYMPELTKSFACWISAARPSSFSSAQASASGASSAGVRASPTRSETDTLR